MNVSIFVCRVQSFKLGFDVCIPPVMHDPDIVDLIVPGKTGFWRTCVVAMSDDEDREHHEWDSVVIEPATSSRAHCERPARKSAEESDQGDYCTTTDETRILLVGANAISTEHSWEGSCGAHPSSATDISLTSLVGRDTIRYLGFTDSTRTRELLTAATEAAREEFADVGTVDSASNDPDDIPSGPRFSTDEQWGVERGQGYWQLKAQASCFPIIACMQVSTFSMPKYRAPRQLVGHNELFPSFDTIKKVVPAARDAVCSPRRDLVVVTTDTDGLLVFTPRDGNLGAPVAQFPVSGKIVMAEWAPGRFVAIWTSKLRKLLP